MFLVDEDQKQCACGAGLSRFGQEVIEKFDYIPARLPSTGYIRSELMSKAGPEHVEGSSSQAEPVNLNNYNPPTATSTRRFIARPSEVALLATGLVSP